MDNNFCLDNLPKKKPGQVWLCVVNYGNFNGGRGDEKNYGR